MTEIDISNDPTSYLAQSKPLKVSVSFATSSGVIETLEGPIRILENDAIVTGIDNEHWPVSRERFGRTYIPVPPTRFGENGFYTKRIIGVVARTLERPLEIELSDNRGKLCGKVGDILVQYAPGDFAIIEVSIFNRTYEKIHA